MSRVIGIDLGTTNSVVSLLDNNRPEVIQNAEGYKTTPSIVHFPEEGEVVVGDLARRQLIVEPKRTVHSVKRFMGCRWDEIEERKEGIFYELASDQDGMATVKIGSKNLRPEDISAEVLIKTIANHLKKSYLTWNRDSVEDAKIIEDLAELSGGKLKLPEGFVFAEVGNISQPKKSRSNTNRKRPGRSSGGSWSRSNNRRRNYRN